MASAYEKPSDYLFNQHAQREHHRDPRKYPSSSGHNHMPRDINDQIWYRGDPNAYNIPHPNHGSRSRRPDPRASTISFKHLFVALLGFFAVSYYLMGRTSSPTKRRTSSQSSSRQSPATVTYSHDLVSRHSLNLQQVISQVEQTKNVLHDQLSDLKDKSHTDDFDRSDLSNVNTILSLSKKLEDARNRHAKVLQEIVTIKDDRDRTLDELSTANTSYTTSLHAIQRAPKNLDALKMKLKNIESEIEGVRKKLLEHEENIKSHSNTRDQLDQNVVQARLRIQTRKAKFESQDGTVQTAQDQVETLKKQLRDHAAKERDTSKNMAEKEEKEKMTRKRLEDGKAQLRAFDSAMRILNLKIESRKSALQMVKKVTTVGGGTLRDAIEAKERGVAQLKNELEEFKQQETDIEDSDGSIDDALSVVRWAREEELRNRERAIEAEENMLKFYIELEAKDLDTAKTTLEGDLAKLRREEAKLSTKLADQKSVVLKLEGELAGIEKEVRDAERFLENAEESRSRIEVSLQNAQTELDDASTYANELKSELEESETGLKTAQEKLKNHDNLKSNGEEYRNDLFQQRSSLESRYSETQSQIVKLIQQQELQLFDIREQEGRVSKALKDVQELGRQLISLNTQREGIMEEIEDLSSELRRHVQTNKQEL